MRSVVVTGASTGIGRACALLLDQKGWMVFAGVRRDMDGDALRKEASAHLRAVRLDVTDPAQVRAVGEEVAAAVGESGLDGLVNNAGTAVAAPLEFVPPQALLRQFEVNVVGQVAVTQALLPLLRKARGRIVNMGSISGLVSLPFMGPYSASKFALEAITDALRVELAPWGIGVAIVEPGSVATPIWDKSGEAATEMAKGYPPEAQALYGAVFERLGAAVMAEGKRGLPPARVAAAVLHALTAEQPRTRYLVAPGGRGRATSLLRRLPDRLRDNLVLRKLKGR
ncbi:MAG TPA: SDR family oxidoreductase [Bacillota bacterium]|nr:SDR family oxidoreductase [Bacillota bacterium]